MQLQGDGNLVVYSSGHVARWASGTQGHPGTVLAIQDDGNVVLVAPGNHPIWATNTVGSGNFVGTPPATVSGPAPLPGPSFFDNGGMVVCSSAPQVMEPIWWNPQVATDANGHEFVKGVVGIKTFGVGCGDSVQIVLQTKVCDFFGCSYKDVATSARYTQLPMNGQEIFPALTAPLRSGTNRYRLELDKTKYVYEGDNAPGPGFAGFVPETESDFSPGVQLTS
jgi:hypothetical protein